MTENEIPKADQKVLSISEILLDLGPESTAKIGFVTGYFRYISSGVRQVFQERAMEEGLVIVVGIYDGPEIKQRVDQARSLPGVHYIVVVPEVGFDACLSALEPDWWIREQR